MKVNKKQALMIASSMLSGEKELSDYGSSAVSESKKIFDDMLSAIEMEEETTDPKMMRNPAIQCADTDEVYDRLYPKVQKPKKKVNKQIKELNDRLVNQAMTILDLEKMGKSKS